MNNFSTGRRGATRQFREKYGARFECVEADLLDRAALMGILGEYPIDQVLHCAAKISVAESKKDPMGYMKTNCEGTANILHAMIRNGVVQLVTSSTAASYG